jgi:hypothetical protein
MKFQIPKNVSPGVNIQESLPFVASDILDEFSFKKVARFLNMVRNGITIVSKEKLKYSAVDDKYSLKYYL